MVDVVTQNILDAVNSGKDEILISEIKYNHEYNNELLLFFKPECFLSSDSKTTKAIIDLSLEKIRKFDTHICGVLLLSGKILEQYEIMDRHYGFINKMSKGASKLLSEDDKNKIAKELSYENISNHEIFGGHEFLAKYDSYDEYSLDKFWLGKKSIKIRSGLYVQEYNIKNDNIILVNGFHPAQLYHFTGHSRKIVLLLLRSNNNWAQLKYDMVGNTFPEKATEDSIRGEIYKRKTEFRLKDVSIANNFVHLSAGPFEAGYEIQNFLSKLKIPSFDLMNLNMLRFFEKGTSAIESLSKALTNPTTEIDNKSNDLFTLTEDLNTVDAINKFKQYFN